MPSMQEIAPTVVHVVTSGVDWPAVTASIATGVAIVAGTFGTIWQSRRADRAAASNLQVTIDSERYRARIAEKRRIYAAYLGSLISVAGEIRNFESCGPEMSEEDRLANRTGVVHADAHAMDVMCELTLIAPPDLARKATLAGQNVSNYADGVVLGEGGAQNLNALRNRLCEAMRADLGESTERSASCPRYGHWWPEDGGACLDCGAVAGKPDPGGQRAR